jgi:pimeloyl-ACP methyl ester carboxylesterase
MTPTRHDLDIDGHRIVALGFNEDKAGTPVFFIHGITSSVNFWADLQAPILKEHFRWYSLSLPGHYPAALPAGFQQHDLTAEMIARVLAGAIRQLVGQQPVILAGHSTGGFAALAIAATAPELVQSVITIGGFVQGRWHGALRPLQIEARMGRFGAALFKLQVKMSFLTYPTFRLGSSFYVTKRSAYFAYPHLDTMLSRLYEDAQQFDLDTMLHYFNRMPDIDIAGWLPRINAPTLVLTGDRDGIVPPTQAHLIAAQVRDSTLVELKGVGHMPMCESPDEYAKAVTDWTLKFQ